MPRQQELRDKSSLRSLHCPAMGSLEPMVLGHVGLPDNQGSSEVLYEEFSNFRTLSDTPIRTLAEVYMRIASTKTSLQRLSRILQN